MNAPQANIKDAREVALNSLIQVVVHGRSLSELQSNINQHQHAALIREMVFGVCRWYFYLDRDAKQMLKKPLRKKDNDVLLVIFLGMYQLQFMKTSDHAAVHETVNLVQKIKKKWAKGLVNALLRQCSKKPNDTIRKEDYFQSYPDWMIQKIKQDWSDKASDIVKYGNEKAETFLRINRTKTTTEQFVEKLSLKNISFNLNELLPSFVQLTQAENVMELPGFEQGLFYVQDGSAQMSAQLLDVKEGMKILDACAAPGGKTTHIAELADNLTITAVEKELQRIQRLKDNIQRLGHNINVVCGDASTPEEWSNGDSYDRILVDAPCSASGIMRRHPDIKILRRQDDIKALNILQSQILNALWPLLKTEGELLYCTCSIFKEENEQQITKFIEHHDDCVEVALKPFDWSIQRPVGLQVLPDSHGFDGFYYAKLKKIS